MPDLRAAGFHRARMQIQQGDIQSGVRLTIEQHVLDTNEGKQLS